MTEKVNVIVFDMDGKRGIKEEKIMGEYDRVLYVLWWECGVANDWHVVGTYTSRAEVLEAARQCLEHDDGSGWYYVNYITLNDMAHKLTE